LIGTESREFFDCCFSGLLAFWLVEEEVVHGKAESLAIDEAKGRTFVDVGACMPGSARSDKMTEAEWLTCRNLQPVAEYLGFLHASKRERWLLACACCRRIWHLMDDHRSRRVIEMRGQHAFDQVIEDELSQAVEAAGQASEDAQKS